MQAFLLSVYSGLGFFLVLAAGASIPSLFERHPITRRDLSIYQIQQELGGQLSKTTSIFGPEDGRFAEATSRYSVTSQPRVQLVVEIGTEADAATVVRYCNANSIDFLGRNGGHGWTESLGAFNGIQISLRQLTCLAVQPGGRSAWLGGGLLAGAVNQQLWDRGLVTTTGACDCVGMTGSALGGGHGRQEGRYGLVSDNLRQLRVVLADGAAVRVNATSHGDLFWALRGAGHNFGLVTSYEINVYPRGPDTWHYHNYLWTGEQLEAVFDALNRFHGNGSTPVDMAANFGYFRMNATVSTESPVIVWQFAYRGSAEEAEALLAPFSAIEAVWDEQGDVPYPQISVAQDTAASDPLCAHGGTHVVSTAGLQVYNATAQRLVYASFARRAAADPELAAAARVFHSGYATRGVEAIDPAGSAYPFRADRHLLLFDAAVPAPVADARRAAARAWAAEVRDLWNAGQPDRAPSAYVNYASGDETVEEMYGHESWRIKRLRSLKAKYDPHNRFRFYNPIVV